MSEFAAPTATPAECDDTVPGYEGTPDDEGGECLLQLMPSVPVPSPENLPAQPEWNTTSITEEAAREAFISYASSKCCYRSAPAREGVITSLEPFNTYRYRLETFTEKRSTKLSYEPYTGQHVDALNQPAPELWAIKAKAPVLFRDDKDNTTIVPHTSKVKNCHACKGAGIMRCKNCGGSGNHNCRGCNGSGFCNGDEICSDCDGKRKENCGRCNGKGNYKCTLCRGKRQLLAFMRLEVQWVVPKHPRFATGSDPRYEGQVIHGMLAVFLADFNAVVFCPWISSLGTNLAATWITYKNDLLGKQSSGLKPKKFSTVSGKEMFTDSQCMVDPVVDFPDASLRQASEHLIQEHQSKDNETSHILQQRHTIELIPVTKVNYDWKEKSHSYIVFGKENRVYTTSYPAACCCSVM